MHFGFSEADLFGDRRPALPVEQPLNQHRVDVMLLRQGDVVPFELRAEKTDLGSQPGKFGVEL